MFRAGGPPGFRSCNVTDRCATSAATSRPMQRNATSDATSRPMQRATCNALTCNMQRPNVQHATPQRATCNVPGPCNSPCNASGRCNCCFRSHRTLLQRFRTLQLLLPEQQNAPVTLLDAATAAPERQNAPATLPDAATATAGATERSCNASGRCNCCCRSHRMLLQRFQMLQLLLLEPQNLLLANAETGRCNCCC